MCFAFFFLSKELLDQLAMRLEKAVERQKQLKAELDALSPEEKPKRLDEKYAKKQQGKCPFCGKTIEALLIEANKVRRDKCLCP